MPITEMYFKFAQGMRSGAMMSGFFQVFSLSYYPIWALWLMAAIVFFFGEWFVANFWLFCFGFGCAGAALAAYLGLGELAQWGVMLGVSGVAILMWGDFLEHRWEWLLIVAAVGIFVWLLAFAY